MLRRSVLNVIGFQTAWFATVLGTAHGIPWLGIIVVPLWLSLHAASSPLKRGELEIALVSAVVGFLFDTSLILMGVFSPVFFLLPAPLSPPWMVVLWMNFSTTLNVSLRNLHGRYGLASILGGVGGPLAYYSGAQLGAMTRVPEAEDLLILAVAWAGAVPVLFWMAGKINLRHGFRPR